jgi:cyclophilin family peptidyl-prolyl cis-trans isomerase
MKRFVLAGAAVVALGLTLTSCGKTENMTSEKGNAEIAVMETSMGAIEIELYRNDAPRTVDNFVKLAEQKYFDGIKFHRIAKGFVIQGGDPTGTGAGGKSIYGKEFDDELNPAAPSFKTGYVRGTLAMANRGPNTNTSQFFIMLQDAPRLPKAYTIFGRVVSGMDVVDRMGAVEITPEMGATDGRPKTDIVITSVRMKQPPAAR